MPLFVPILIGAAALLAAGSGAENGYKGAVNIKNAKGIVNTAKQKYDRHLTELEKSRKELNTHAHEFGVYKLEVTQSTLGRMVRLLEQLQLRGKIKSFETLDKVDVEFEKSVGEIKKLTKTATSLMSGTAQGAVVGAAASAGLCGLASAVGVASTGAAIGGLSGAAAQSATLAWLGGGALSAGGFGMLSGTAVLGGVVAGPIIAIIGWKVAVEGEKALTNANKYKNDVDKAVETMHNMQEALTLIDKRIDELKDVIDSLRQRAERYLSVLESGLDTWNKNSHEDTTMLSNTMLLCKALADLIAAPIIDKKDGEVNPKLPGLISKYREYNP